MTAETLPKVCHVCGVDVEPNRLWQYERDGVFDSLRARCEPCSLRDSIALQEASLVEYYRNLAGLYQRLFALIDGRDRRDS